MKIDEVIRNIESLSRDEQRILMNKYARKFANSGCNECPLVDICETAMMISKSPCLNIKEY